MSIMRRYVTFPMTVAAGISVPQVIVVLVA
jgi:hypothetical protein